MIGLGFISFTTVSKYVTVLYDYFFSDVFNTYRCSHCQYPIDGLRVQCTTCPDFEMCLQVSKSYVTSIWHKAGAFRFPSAM